MITKICNSKLCVASNMYGNKKATTHPVFRSDYSKDDYIADYERQKRNALNTSLAVVAGSLFFTAAYIFLSVLHRNGV